MDLSVLIPARNEEWLGLTLKSVLDSSEAETEVIVVLDGAPALTALPEDSRLTVINLPESIGQRAATNLAARGAKGKYVMKLDAHCIMGPGFDRIMIEDMQPDWTMVPKMYNLHAFDWVCTSCGHTMYQGPTPQQGCPECGAAMQKTIRWLAKPSPETTAMRFDKDLKFQYWSAYKKKQKGDLVETMSLLGACWMLELERYWALNICDEAHGGWGQQGTEVACKTHLSGGKLICNKRTWFSHLFRTQGLDFGFPYPISGKDVGRARAHSRWLWLEGGYDKAIYPLSWLLEKFWPVPGWEEVDLATLKQAEASRPNLGYKSPAAPGVVDPAPSPMTNHVVLVGNDVVKKGLVYYTDNLLDERINRAVRRQLELACNGLELVTVSLKPIGFGRNVVLGRKRGIMTMFKQILAGLEACTADVVFFAEHDVLYHPSHFAFVPERDDLFYYNQNCWRVDAKTGHALFYYANSTSGLCAYRELLLKHYRKRVEMVREFGFSRRMGFEPGTHRRKERVDDYWHGIWMSDAPNIDIRHGKNLTPSRWRKDQFRNQKYTRGWAEAEEVPGWGKFEDVMSGILSDGV